MASSCINCVNLCDQTHCDWWLEQIVCLIESHGMKNVFLDVRLKPTKENGDSKNKADKSFVGPKRSDALVILIYGSLSHDVVCTAFRIHKTNDVWKKVDAYYKYSTRDQLQDKDVNYLWQLAGRLEPIHKLNVVSGAALQMQRELQCLRLVIIAGCECPFQKEVEMISMPPTEKLLVSPSMSNKNVALNKQCLQQLLSNSNVASRLKGGWKPIPNVTDPAIVDIGKFAIDEHNKNDQAASLQFRNVVQGQSQVVAGMNYNLTIAAALDGDHVQNNYYVAIVWIKPWEQFRRLVSFNGPI
ncbi:cysteine proteinase inhibitor 5-like protein [Tanacetum coccineum]